MREEGGREAGRVEGEGAWEGGREEKRWRKEERRGGREGMERLTQLVNRKREWSSIKGFLEREV